MSPLLGFSDNLFQCRDDVLKAATSLLRALEPYKSPCGARVRLATATGAGFDEIAAQLEGFARPLWVVADLLTSQTSVSGRDSLISDLSLDSWIRGLEVGVNPESDTFWGYLSNYDQRMVEMEPIAYGLLSAPVAFLRADSGLNQQNREMIVAWLRSINDREMPPSNWRWFRVLVNLALVKSCGVPYHEVKPVMDADFEILDSFYMGDGWSSDGLWSDDKKQADYYSGSFAIQYSQLAYVRFAHDIDPERVKRYQCEAQEFAGTFWRYFDVNGAAIPFGRSLTYRFAFAAFWSAITVVDIPLPPPLDNPGTVKGLILRHLRWWAKQIGIFNTDGTLTIGYTYPNMYMSEDYNSPQSPYWCLKTFSILGLGKEHSFWNCEELPHPLVATCKLDLIRVISPPVHITCSFREHHFLLSAGQSTKKPHKAREAKYSKFAYSSAFAFSVPAGPLLSQMAPDSTLCISDDGGETWRVRWEPIAARIQTIKLNLRDRATDKPNTITTPVLISAWQPRRNSDFQAKTILIPPSERWPGWHLRVHKFTWRPQKYLSFQVLDSGFAISSQGVKGGLLPPLNGDLRATDTAGRGVEGASREGFWEGDSDCLILSNAGASGVAELQNRVEQERSTISMGVRHSYRSYILKPDPNTNLVAPRTLIPTILHHFQHHDPNNHQSGDDCDEAWLVTGVFAITSSAGLNPASIRKMWQDKPGLDSEDYINL
ncbi:hypothetical protein F5884DRAFT_29030 [Xylogone sp. PMI_703]|nr:hypothetical protein F5884DRAFT_29030 [Xylogone sp. PMI_703]